MVDTGRTDAGLWTVTATHTDPATGRSVTQSVEGTGPTAAAFLRSVADQADPPTPAHRGRGIN